MNKITSISIEDCKRIIDEAKSILNKPEKSAEEKEPEGGTEVQETGTV